jgi:hypothetical protein
MLAQCNFRLGPLARLVKLYKQPHWSSKNMAPEKPSWVFASFCPPFFRCGTALPLIEL